MKTNERLWRRYRSETKRQQIIKHAAVFMDLEHPGWATRINALPRFGGRAFNLQNIACCVIGAGTGRNWSTMEATRLSGFVKKTLKLKAGTDELLNLTADQQWEPYWLEEVRKRVEA